MIEVAADAAALWSRQLLILLRFGAIVVFVQVLRLVLLLLRLLLLRLLLLAIVFLAFFARFGSFGCCTYGLLVAESGAF